MIQTGCKLLDLLFGGNKGVYGFPTGKFINIVGDRSSGKSFLASEIVAYSSYNIPKFKWVYDDCESGYSFNTQELYGFEMIPQDNPIHSTTVEEAFCNINNFADSLKEDEQGVYVLDSLDALSSIEQEERAEKRVKAFNSDKSFEKGSYNTSKQRYLSQEFFPQLCSKIQTKNVLVIIISQVRENIDTFSFEKFSRSGGKAMDFYAHSVIWLATCQKISKKDRVIGVVVKAKTTKSKTPRPFRECFFTFLYDYGLDSIGTNVDYLYDLRTSKGELSNKAKAISWDNDGELNLDTLVEFLNNNDLMNKYKLSSYYDGNLDIESIIGFIQRKKAYKELYESTFGSTMSRDELIEFIEKENKEDELALRTENKWEKLEEDIRSNRKKRY